MEAADIVVNPTDPELKHKTGISKHIAKLGKFIVEPENVSAHT